MKKNNCNEIRELFQKYYKHLNGLTLFMNPPGSGKSYETSLFIADLIGKTNRDIYYITPRLDNVDELYNDLISAIGKEKEKTFKVLKIESNCNSVMNALTYLDNDLINSWEETKKLKRKIKNYQSAKEEDYRKLLENEIFYKKGNYEYSFRKKLGLKFRKEYKKQKNKYKSAYEYMRKSEWNFIEKIYPVSSMEKKEVFILSSKKFFGMNDPVIKKPYMFTEEENIKNAIIIIDEFDAIKAELLDSILNDNIEMNVIRLFKDIYSKLQDIDSIDENMLKTGKGNCKKQLEELKEKSEILNEKFFPETKNIKLLKSDSNKGLRRLENTEQILSYKGVHAFPTLRGETYFYLPYNEKNLYHNNRDTFETCNLILHSKEVNLNSDDAYTVSYFINQIRRFVNKALRSFYYISLDYQNEKNKYYLHRSSNEENLITLKDAIGTVLSNMNFLDNDDNLYKYINYVINSTEPNMYQYFNKDKKDVDKSIYSNGLYYTSDIEKDITRDNSQIYNYQLYTTPEQIMLNLCTYAHVIGVSATASVHSINNFNIKYLSKKLEERGSKFHTISSEEEKRLESDYDKKTIGYKTHNLKTKVIPIEFNDRISISVVEDLAYLKSENYTDEDVMNIEYSTRELNLRIRSIEKNIQEKNIYEYKSLYKIWEYIKSVMKLHEKENVLSNGMLFLNKSIGHSIEDIYTLENVKLGAAFAYCGIYKVSYKEAKEAVNDMFVFVNAEKFSKYKDEDLDDINFKAEYRKIKKAFIENKLIFLITTYNSISRGNNPQVKVGEENTKTYLKSGRLFEVNDIFKKYHYLDWDSIYIEKPSYVIPNINDISKDNIYKEKLRALFIIEDACERDGISVSNKTRIINDLYNRDKNYSNGYSMLYRTQSVKNAYTVSIYQTIGRISRTNLKKQYNAIFYDSDIIDVIETDKNKTKLQNTTNEFETFRKEIKIQQSSKKYEYKKNIYENFTKQNARCKNAISGILKEAETSGWNKDKIKFWESLRNTVLKYPTGITKKEIKNIVDDFDKFECVRKYNFDVSDCYYEFTTEKNKYYFNADEGGLYISRDNKKNSRMSKSYPFEVSLDDSRLSYFNHEREVKEYFTERGYRMDWNVKSRYMMCPYIYQAIYKGALGEEILKAVLDKKCGYEIVDITEERAYEKFDFIIKKDKLMFFVDAKNYSESTISSELANKKLLEKLKKKISFLNIKKCFVINLIDEKGDRHFVPRSNFIAVPGIYTFINNNRVTLKMSTEIDEYKVIDQIQQIVSIAEEEHNA